MAKHSKGGMTSRRIATRIGYDPAVGLTADQVRQLLNYDPDTGFFTWAISVGNLAPFGARAGSKSKVKSGRRNNYIRIMILGRAYKAHRLAWLWMTGEWPSQLIDHIDGDGSNNKWGNLREATTSQNNANASLYRNNSSGRKGVYWCRREKKWLSQITIGGRRRHLGYFDRIDLADAAYREAAQKLFGEFARAA